MVQITYVEADGVARTVDVKPGLSLMEGATSNAIDGIDADCGGSCACATCHIYVTPDWQSVAGERSDMEEVMLDFANDVAENSRLSCQIQVTDAFDGMVVHIPKAQR